MNAKRLVIATLLAATAFPLSAAQPQPTDADDAPHTAVPAEAPVLELGDAQSSTQDRWTVPVSASRPLAADPEDASVAANAAFDPAPKRPALNFADQQPVKPNMFDSPTAWEDDP